MCGRELLKWRWRLTYLPCPQLHNIHSDSQDVLNMLFLCGVWISKRKEDASVDDSLGQEVKLCEKVLANNLEGEGVHPYSHSYCYLEHGGDSQSSSSHLGPCQPWG